MVQTATTTTDASVFAPAIAELPTGYTGLPRELVVASQRQRLLYGVTLAVADRGFGLATVAEITAHAGVSKKTFYEHFDAKLDCFLAAYDHGRQAMLGAVVAAGRAAVEAGAPPVAQLHRSTAAYLDFLVREERFARTFFLEILAAGAPAIERHHACREAFTESLRVWHTHARAAHPDWPSARPVAYEAATGAVNELALERVATGRTAELAALEDDLVAVQLAVLGVPVDA